MTAAVRSSTEDTDFWAPTDPEGHAERAGMSLHERLSRTVVRGRAGLQGESPFGDLDDAPTESAQSVAMARFTEVVDALRGEFSPGDVAAIAAARPAGDECCPDGLSFRDETGRQDQLTDEAIEQVESGQLAQVEPITNEIAARPADDIQHALLQVREQIQAMEQSSERRAVERLAESPAEARRHLTPEFKSAGTARQLGVEIARIVDVMEARFERIEVANAKRVADLGAEIRQEIAQMIDALAARVSDLEPRAPLAAVDVGDQRLPSTGFAPADGRFAEEATDSADASYRMVEREQHPSSGRRERSIFAWLRFQPNRPSRTQTA
jgi:hypothetical protein